MTRAASAAFIRVPVSLALERLEERLTALQGSPHASEKGAAFLAFVRGARRIDQRRRGRRVIKVDIRGIP